MDSVSNPPARQRNQRGEGARLREEVVDAAMRILDGSPATTLSLRMVAKEVGVAAPSLYRQFTDADAMMKEVVRSCWHQMGVEMTEVREAAQPLQRLEAQLGAYVRYAMQTPARYRLLFALPSSWDTEIDGPIRPVYRVILQSVEQHAEAGGRLPAEDAASAAIFAISVAHGRVALAHLAPARSGNAPVEVEAFVQKTIRHVFSDQNASPLDHC